MPKEEAIVNLRTLRQQAVADVERFCTTCKQRLSEIDAFENLSLKLFWFQAHEVVKKDLQRRYRIINNTRKRR